MSAFTPQVRKKCFPIIKIFPSLKLYGISANVRMCFSSGIDQESMTPQLASPNQKVFQSGVKALAHGVSADKRKGD